MHPSRVDSKPLFCCVAVCAGFMYNFRRKKRKSHFDGLCLWLDPPPSGTLGIITTSTKNFKLAELGRNPACVT